MVLRLNKTGDRRITFENLHIHMYKTSYLCQKLLKKRVQATKSTREDKSYLQRRIAGPKYSGLIWHTEMIWKYVSDYPQSRRSFHWFCKKPRAVLRTIILETKILLSLQRLNSTHNPVEYNRCCYYSHLSQTENDILQFFHLINTSRRIFINPLAKVHGWCQAWANRTAHGHRTF